jgi:hypothetical protein
MRLLGLALTGLAVFAGAAAAARIEGTARPQRIVGTAAADLIIPRGGADRVLAGSGDDRVVAQYDGAVDTIACGPGRDVVTADGSDRVAADCELVSHRISRDIHRNDDSQHETQVEPDSLTVGNTTVAAFQSGRRFNGAAANIAWAVSTDNGRTWRSGELPGVTRNAPRPGPSEAASDPVVAYSALHGVWLISTLAIRAPTRLTISRSTDGRSWGSPIDAASAPPVGEQIAFDKQWVTCDNGGASPFRGRCYLVYNDWVRRGMSLQTSTDGGLTWSQPVTMQWAPFLLGHFPVVRPDGTLVIVTRFGTNERSMVAIRSRDGGATLDAPVTIGPIRLAPAGHRAPDIPAADVDASGRVWAAWHSCTARPSCDGNDVLVSSSADGVTWTPPVRATTGRNASIPTIAAGPGGRVGVVYYVARSGGIDAEFAESRDGGRSWGAPQRLNTLTMPVSWLPNTTSGRMLADYVSLTYPGGRPLAVWALASEPTRSGRLSQAIFATRLP